MNREYRSEVMRYLLKADTVIKLLRVFNIMIKGLGMIRFGDIESIAILLRK